MFSETFSGYLEISNYAELNDITHYMSNEVQQI